MVGPWVTEQLGQGYLAVNWEATVDEVAVSHPAPSHAQRGLGRGDDLAHRTTAPRLTARDTKDDYAMADITMPQLGETVTEGTITKWFKQVGDQVAEDEPLFEVSTDKVDSEVPSPAAGYLTEIQVPEGETVDVGAVLAVIGDAPAEGGDGRPRRRQPRRRPRPRRRQPAGGGAGPPPEERSRSREAARGRARGPESAPEAPEAPEAPGRRRAAPTAATADGDGPSCSRRSCADSSPSTASTRRRSRAPVSAGASPATTSSPSSRPAAATAARQRAAPAQAAPAAPAAPARRSSPRRRPAAPAALGPTGAGAAGERDTAVPHTNIRKRTAEHMARSKQTSAHVYAAMEVDYEAVEVVRRAQKDSWRAEEGFSLTYLPFISRAVVDAIREFPEVNATFTDDDLIVHNYVNLGSRSTSTTRA